MHGTLRGSLPGEPGLIVAKFFGRFLCTIGDREIPWLRRMDRRIFRYLLLTQNGRATRDELLTIFWIGTEPKSGTLSLRTACSNIRKAIGSLTGLDQTENYFSTANETLQINLEQMNVDVRRFIGHIRTANLSYAGDDFKAAYGHYKRALSIYTGRIGWGDEPESWLEPLTAECAALQRTAIERLAEISRKSGFALRALEYEALLARDGGSAGTQVLA